MREVWDEVRERIDDGDLGGLADVLAGLDAKDRAALVPLLDAHTLEPVLPEPVPDAEPETNSGGMGLRGPATATPMVAGGPLTPAAAVDEEVVRHQAWVRRNSGNVWFLRAQADEVARQRNAQRHAALSLAVVACVGPVAEAVKRLHLPWPQRHLKLVPETVPVLLRIRGADWCATLARGMLRRVRSTVAAVHWPFTEAMLRAVGSPPPEEPAAVVLYVAAWRGPSLVAFLAADPWFDRLLPYLFDDNRVAAAFAGRGAASDWPLALLELAATGRIARETLIAGCLRRLRAGGRPGLLQPYLAVLRELDPDAAELAGHRQELTGLLAAPLSTVAEHAYLSLRALHDTSPLDLATLTEITAGMLSRPEKKLVRAHLTWLRKLPLDDLLDGVVAGLHHPAAELAGRTLDLLGPRLPGLPPAARDRLRDEVPALDGAVGQRLAALLGTAAPAPAPVATLVPALPEAFPPPLDLGALAGDLATLARTGDVDPVRHELLLAGLVRAARGDRSAAARVLEQAMPPWPGPWADMVAAVTGLPAPPPYEDPYRSRRITTLGAFIDARCTELAARLGTDPPPALLATPATVAGHVDPDRVLGLLKAAERDGWQPGPADLTQALLRLPRTVDPAVHAAAARFTSPAGRRFAAGLGPHGEPRTWVEEVPDQQYYPGRRIAMLDLTALPADPWAGIADPRPAAERTRHWYQAMVSLWPMVAPSHREVVAAHIQPYLVAPMGSPGTAFLDGLAAADGPPGPAMALVLAYTFGSHRENIRLAAADALVTMAARPGWDGTHVGTEVAALACTDRIVLQRTVQPLTEALKAGAHDAVWQVTSAALPALLAANPRPGLPDLIALAADAAGSGGHPIDPAALPALRALAGRPGRGRLVESARRLAALAPERAG